MTARLRVRKDAGQVSGTRWRVEIASNPVGSGSSVGLSSWVDAMVTAERILTEVEVWTAPIRKAAGS